jgi:hypothetical protein
MSVKKRWTVTLMHKKYLALHKQNYESVLITEVLGDLYRIKREQKIPKEDL